MHPQHRSYTVLKTYQKIVPLVVRADLDTGTEKEKAGSIKLPGVGGHIFNYRYVPWQYNGEHRTDTERRKYQAYKWWWTHKGILCGRLKH